MDFQHGFLSHAPLYKARLVNQEVLGYYLRN